MVNYKATETKEGDTHIEFDSVFETLSKINVNESTDKKGNITYISWAESWSALKKVYPNANMKIYEHDTQFGPCNYFTDGRFCWVKVGVTVEGLEHIEELAVMDYRNAAIPLNQITSTDVQKAIQRCATKAIARHGLALYIYRGEDLPDEEAEKKKREEEKEALKEAQEATKGKDINGVVTSGKLPVQDDVPPAYQI